MKVKIRQHLNRCLCFSQNVELSKPAFNMLSASLLLIFALLSPAASQDYMSKREIRELILDQPLSTSVPSKWMFRSDGTEFSYGIGMEKWTACGEWELRGNVLCWAGLVTMPNGAKFPYGPRCSRVIGIAGGVAFTKSAQSEALQEWNVRWAKEIEPSQSCPVKAPLPLLSGFHVNIIR